MVVGAIAVLAEGFLELQQRTSFHACRPLASSRDHQTWLLHRVSRRLTWPHNSTVASPSAFIQEMLTAQRAALACTSSYQSPDDTCLVDKQAFTRRPMARHVAQKRRACRNYVAPSTKPIRSGPTSAWSLVLPCVLLSGVFFLSFLLFQHLIFSLCLVFLASLTCCKLMSRISCRSSHTAASTSFVPRISHPSICLATVTLRRLPVSRYLSHRSSLIGHIMSSSSIYVDVSQVFTAYFYIFHLWGRHGVAGSW